MLLAMIQKDLLVILKDRKSLIITLCMPAVLTTILGFAFGSMMSGDYTLGKANIAIVSRDVRELDMERITDFLDNPNSGVKLSDEQKANLSELLRDMNFEKILYDEILENPEIKNFIQYKKMGYDKALSLLKKGDIAAAVVLPEGFTYDTFMNLVTPFRNPITIEVIKHPDHMIKGEMISAIVKGFTDALSAGIIAKNVLFEASVENNVGSDTEEEIGDLIKGMYNAGVRDIKVNKITAEGKKAVSSFQYYAAGMAVMFILYVAADGAQYSIDEVNNGTYRRLIMAGAGRIRFFLSRFTATALFAVLQLTVLISYSSFVFKTDWGNPRGAALLSFFLSVAIGGMAVLLSAINLMLKNSKASIVFQAVVIQFSALMGGSFFPVTGIPIMQKIGGYTINGAAMKGYLKLMMGYSPGELTGTMITLAVISLVLFAAGAAAAASIKEV